MFPAILNKTIKYERNKLIVADNDLLVRILWLGRIITQSETTPNLISFCPNNLGIMPNHLSTAWVHTKWWYLSLVKVLNLIVPALHCNRNIHCFYIRRCYWIPSVVHVFTATIPIWVVSWRTGVSPRLSNRFQIHVIHHDLHVRSCWLNTMASTCYKLPLIIMKV